MDIYEEVERFYDNIKTEKRIIGESVFHRKLFAIKIGDGYPVGIAQYAMHGREFITAKLAMHHYETGIKTGSFWLVPLVNPDGALLSQKGLQSVEDAETKKRLIEWNGGEDFSQWKANGRGVDLNQNFAARWGKGSKNTREAGAENYIGERPFSEPETIALKRFTEEISPNYTVSYHTKGEEIYWYFYQPIYACALDKALAISLSRSTGYPLCFAKGSAGGYKDWCIEKRKIPAFTIEAGADELSHPIGEAGLRDIIEKNGRALRDLAEEFQRRCGN